MPTFDRDAQDWLEKAKITATFRYGLISPVVNGLFPDASAIAYYRRVTEKPIKRPDGTEFQYEAKTLERWKSDYDRYGSDALMPRKRSDKGSSRVLSSECIDYIRELMVKYPRLGGVQIHDRLLQKKLIDMTISIRAVQRRMKRELFLADNSDGKDRKAFEYDKFGMMYQGDSCYFPYIEEEGKKRRTYLLSLVDDHTRVVVAAQLFYEDNSYNFQKVLKNACATHGSPKMLYVDSGSPYKNTQLSFICATLGIDLIHAPIRDGAAKAKIERYHGVLKQRWIYGLDVENIHSLKEFNVLLNDQIREHNRTINSSIEQSPMDRYIAAEKVAKMPTSQEWLDEAFMNREMRKVKKDATISIKPFIFDAPRQFIGHTIEVRFLPDQWEKAYIFSEEKHYPLRVTNKYENAITKRDKTPYSIDYSQGNEDV